MSTITKEQMIEVLVKHDLQRHIAELACDNAHPDCFMNLDEQSVEDWLSISFIWAQTPQGNAFWMDVCDMLTKLPVISYLIRWGIGVDSYQNKFLCKSLPSVDLLATVLKNYGGDKLTESGTNMSDYAKIFAQEWLDDPEHTLKIEDARGDNWFFNIDEVSELKFTTFMGA